MKKTLLPVRVLCSNWNSTLTLETRQRNGSDPAQQRAHPTATASRPHQARPHPADPAHHGESCARCVSSPTATQSWNTFLKGFNSRFNTRDYPKTNQALPGDVCIPHSRHWRPSGVRSKKAGQPGCLVLPCLYFGALAAVGGET